MDRAAAEARPGEPRSEASGLGIGQLAQEVDLGEAHLEVVAQAGLALAKQGADGDQVPAPD